MPMLLDLQILRASATRTRAGWADGAAAADLAQYPEHAGKPACAADAGQALQGLRANIVGHAAARPT